MSPEPRDDLREHHGGAGRLVELGHAELQFFGGLQLALAGSGRTRLAQLEGGLREPPRVQNNPYLLAALGGELARDKLGATRGGGPGDVAQLVTSLVVAQALELASDSAKAKAALLQLDLAGAHQVERRCCLRPVQRRERRGSPAPHRRRPSVRPAAARVR